MADTESVYLVKHIRWKRGPMVTDTVPILLQDINGPCPILAIFNILLLRGSVNLPQGVGEVQQVGRGVYEILGHELYPISPCSLVY